MLRSRGGGGGGRKLLSKALPCVLVILWLLVIATPVSAPSVPAAVQERISLLTDEVAALKEIASAINRMVTINWSWIKVSLFGIGSLLVTGVTTLYLADYGRKRWSHWEFLRPPSLEDVFTPLIQLLADKLDALKDQLAAPLERTATTTVRSASEVVSLRAQVAKIEAKIDHLQILPTPKVALEPFTAYAKKGAEAFDRMAMSTPSVERQVAAYAKEVEDLRSVMTNLLAQLDAMRIADAERKEMKRKRKIKLIGACLTDNDSWLDKIEGEYMIDDDGDASRGVAVSLTNSGALESIATPSGEDSFAWWA